MLLPHLRHFALAAGLTMAGPLAVAAQTSTGPVAGPSAGVGVPSAQGQPIGVPPAPAVPGKTPQWPVTVPEPGKSQAVNEPQAEAGWSKEEIAEAQAQCAAALAKHSATVVPVPAIREGDCGAPYPVQLTAIGKVELSQPAIVTCRMVEVLGDWLKHDVQPAAKRHLGAVVTRLDVMSSYSCRNAYGRKKSRLSEHGRANALDIKSFGLNRGGVADLLADWGLTERDIKARIAAAEAQARALAAAKAKADAEAKAVAEAQAKAKAAARAAAERKPTWPGEGEQPSFSATGLAVLRGMVPDAIGPRGEGQSQGRDASTLTLEQPSRLGGPKAKSETASAPVAPATPGPASKSLPPMSGAPAQATSGAQAFLRQIHEAACKRFGTVLGPEANDAHRNHFHLDMAERNGRGSFCE